MLIYTALSRSKETKPITSCKRNPGSASHRKRQDDCGVMTWSQCNSLLPAHRQLFSTKHLSQFKFFSPLAHVYVPTSTEEFKDRIRYVMTAHDQCGTKLLTGATCLGLPKEGTSNVRD